MVVLNRTNLNLKQSDFKGRKPFECIIVMNNDNKEKTIYWSMTFGL